MILFFCFLEMIRYIIAERLFFDRKDNRYLSYIIGFIVFGIFSLITGFSLEQQHIVIYVVTLIAFFFSQNGDLKNKISNLFIIFFIMTSVSGLVEFIYDLTIENKVQDITTQGLYFTKDLISLLLLGTGIIIKSRTSKSVKAKFRGIAIENSIYVIIFSAIMITFTISLLNYSKQMIANEKYQIMAVVISGIAYISIGLLGGTAIYIKKMHDETKMLMKNEILLKDMQKKYYEALLEQDKETRAYRHDMSNHLIALSEFAKRGETDKVVTYIANMRGKIHEIVGGQYKTGNETLDIMTNFYLPQLSEHIHVTVQTSAEVDLNEMEICTIYANLLQNAVEELNSDMNREGELHIAFKQTGAKYVIMIENSIFRRKSNRLITHKEDKRNHGIGLANVKSVVEDLNGKIFITNDTNMFKVIVELNKKETVDGLE